MTKRSIAILSALLLGAIAVFWIFVLLTPSFQTCIDDAAKAYHQKYDGKGAQPVANVPFLLGYWPCAGESTHVNSEPIIAFSTALLAAITIGLVLLGLEQGETTRAQLRGYVFPIMGQPSIKEGVIPSIRITVKNYGATPVRNMTVQGDVFPCPIPAKIVGIRRTKERGPETVIAPGDASGITIIEGSKALTAPDIEAIEKKKAALFFIGLIVYRDAFGTKRETRFCWEWNGESRTENGAIQRRIDHSAAGNSWT